MRKNQNLKLIIGDKNLSSWSMRPWLVLKSSGLPFDEIKIALDRPETAEQLAEHSPSGRVPVLVDGGMYVWDSLSICEYIAELAPDKELWPADPRERAIARSYVAEMHSGFQSLRDQMSMDLSLRMKIKHIAPQTVANIQRILDLWASALEYSGGPFLFGSFGIVDAFYAPVVFRFISYGIKIKNPRLQKYMKAIVAQPAVNSWVQAAKKEKSYQVTF